MSHSKRKVRICNQGHQYFKTTDCPTCPVCEKERKPKTGFMSLLSAPSRRALENKGITSLNELSNFSKKEILALHGIGPASIPVLQKLLAADGLSFKI